MTMSDLPASKFPHTPPRQSWTFSQAVNAEIRRAAETGIYDIRGAGAKRQLRRKADPGKRYDIDMYTQGHTVRGAPKLPLNLLDALREYDKDKMLKAMMGSEFSSAYLKLKHQEWTSYVSHFSRWEHENTVDI